MSSDDSHPSAHRYLMWRPADAPEFFSDEAYSRLSVEYKFPTSAALRLRDLLEVAAYQYWAAKTGTPAPKGRRKAQVDKYRKIEKFARQLDDALRALDEEEARLLWKADALAQHDQILGRERTRFGQKIHRYDLPGLSEASIRPNPDDLVETPSVLANYAQHAVGEVPPSKMGPPKNIALEAFIAAMANIWMGVLEQDFTRDFHAGSPLTSAASFCVDVAEIVDPEISKDSINSSMASLIKSMRNAENK